MLASRMTRRVIILLAAIGPKISAGTSTRHAGNKAAHLAMRRYGMNARYGLNTTG